VPSFRGGLRGRIAVGVLLVMAGTFLSAARLRIVLVGAAVTVVTAGYARGLGGEHNVEHARAMALAVPP
jgi:hypothetical protein